MITDHAANDGPAQEDPVIAPEWTTVRPGPLFDLVGDHLGGAPAKLNNLRPVKVTGRQLGATGSQLIGTVDPECGLADRQTRCWLGERLRKLNLVLGKHGDLGQLRSRLD